MTVMTKMKGFATAASFAATLPVGGATYRLCRRSDADDGRA